MAEQKLTLKLIADSSGAASIERSLDNISKKTEESKKIEQEITRLTNERKLALAQLEASIAKINSSNLNNALSLGAANASLTAYNRTLEQTRTKLLELNQDKKKAFDLANLPTNVTSSSAIPTGFNFATGGISSNFQKTPTVNASTVSSITAPKGFNYATGSITQNNQTLEQQKLQTAEIDKQNKKLKEQEYIHKNLFTRLAEAIASYRVINAGYNAVLNFARNIPEAGIRQQAAQASLSAVFGTEKGLDNLKYLKSLANEAGQSITSLQEAYGRFAPSAVLAGASQTDVNNVFRDFTKVGTVLHFSEQQITSLYLALEQMYGKTTVQSEEIKKQLGNVLPGAVEIGAKAWAKYTKSTDDSVAAFMAAMKKNQVEAKKFIPEFAALYAKIFGGENDAVFEDTRTKFLSNLQRMKNQYEYISQDMFTITEGLLNNLVKFAGDSLKTIRENLTGIVQVVETMAGLLTLKLAGGLLAFLFGSKEITNTATGVKSVVSNVSLLLDKLKEGSAIKAFNPVSLGLIATTFSIGELILGLNNASLAYDKATGFTIKFADAQVSVSSYIKSVYLTVLESLKDVLNDVAEFGKDFSNKLLAFFDSIAPTLAEELRKIGEGLGISFKNGLISSMTPDSAFFKSFAEQWELRKAIFFGEASRTTRAVPVNQAGKVPYFRSEDIKPTSTINNKAIEIESLETLKNLRAKTKKEISQGILDGIDNGLKFSDKEIADTFKTARDIAAPTGIIGEGTTKQVNTAKTSAKDMSAAYKDLARSSSEASKQIAADIRNLDSLYKYQAISIEDYFREKEDLQLKDLNQQISIFEKQKVLAGKFGDTAKVEEFSDKISSAYERIKEAQDSIANSKLEEQFKFNDMLRAAELDYQKFTNDTAGLQAANLSDINTKYKAIEVELISLIEKGSEFAKTALEHVKAVKADELAMKNLTSSQEKLNLYSSILKDKEESIRNAREIGLLSEQQATQQLIDARNEYTDIAKRELDLTYEIALANKDNAKVMLEFYKQKKAYETNAFPQLGTADKVINSDSGGIFFSQIGQIRSGLTTLDNLKAGKQQAYQQAELQSQYQGIYQTQLDAQQIMLDKKAEADRKYSEATLLTYSSMFDGILTMGADVTDGLLKQTIARYGADSKEAKKAFAMHKAMAASQIVISTAAGAMKAYEQTGIYGVVGAGLIVIQGGIQLAQVLSEQMPAAHGGLDYVPKEQTYLLDKGERVLSPRQNKDLTNYMQQGNMGKDKQNSTGNIRIINSIDPSVFHEYLGTDEGEKVVMNIVRRNRESA